LAILRRPFDCGVKPALAQNSWRKSGFTNSAQDRRDQKPSSSFARQSGATPRDQLNEDQRGFPSRKIAIGWNDFSQQHTAEPGNHCDERRVPLRNGSRPQQHSTVRVLMNNRKSCGWRTVVSHISRKNERDVGHPIYVAGTGPLHTIDIRCLSGLCRRGGKELR
jgi:hypothetical protein